MVKKMTRQPHAVSRSSTIVEVDESLVSKYCVVKYNGKACPGLILSVNEDEELAIKTIQRVGRNRFFWPMMDDDLWYPKENPNNRRNCHDR